MEDIRMRKIDRPLQAHEKGAVLRIFEALDRDSSDDMSDEELRELFQRFGFETNPACLAHVGDCLRSWEAERVPNKNSRPVVGRATFEAWWPSILDYFERISATLGQLDARGEEGFDLLLQPFQDAGYGPALCSDAPLAVDKITHMCHSLGVYFKDSNFTPSDASIGTKQERQTQWKRISEFVGSKSLMFADGTNAGDTVAGSYGRNKYAADITSLADRFDLLMTVVYPPRYNPAGVYAVKLQRDGELVYVIVDDYIPVDSSNNPAFLRSADPKEIWPLIIDKAFAKLKTSYEKLHMSVNLMLDPLSLLAGSRPSTLTTPKAMGMDDRINMYWSCIRLYMDNHWFMCAAPAVADAANGLILDHFYSIIGYAEDDAAGLRLVQARNPMGTAEWKGAWSDDSPEWKRNPRMAQRCLAVDADDGGFWITVEDFVSRFGSLRCNALLPKGTIPVEDFDLFGRCMLWGTSEMAWREAHMYIDEKKKIRDEMTHSLQYISEHRGEFCVGNDSVMTPFDCPQFRIQVPPGQAITFYYRGCRLLDADGDGQADDDEFYNNSEFDAWQYLSKDMLQMELPYSYIVRGDGRQTVLPTKHILSSNFSSYTACTLSPGTYVLMMIAFDRPDVPLKLTIRCAPQVEGLLRVSELAPSSNVSVFESGGSGLRGLARYLPTGSPEADLKRPSFREISPFLKIQPSSPTIKNITLVLIIASQYDSVSPGAGKLYLSTLRSPLSNPFQWETLTGKSELHSSRIMRTLYYSGSGQGFVVLPFLTGSCPRGVPFTLLAWSAQGKIDISSI